MSISLATALAVGGILAAGALSVPERSPTPPLTFRVVDTTPTSISLAWRSPTGSATEYRLRLGRKLLVTTRARAYHATGLRCGKAYQFTLEALDAAGNRLDRRFLVSATEACPDRVRPGAPTGIVSVGTSETTISIRWTPSADNVGVAGYGIYVGGLQVTRAQQPAYTFTRLACGTSYALALDSYDRAGNRSPRTAIMLTTSACRDTQAPASPTALRASVTQTSASLSWTPARDNVGVAGYSVSQDGIRVGTTKGSSHLLGGLACGRSYAISVEAYDDAGNRSQPATLTVSTRACSPAPAPPPPPPTTPPTPVADREPPTVPGPIEVTAASDTTITITWGPSRDNRGVAGYGVYLDGTLVAGTTRTTTTLSGLVCSTSYAAAVDGYDAAGNRSARESVVVSTSPCEDDPDTEPPTTPSELALEETRQTTLTLTWQRARDNRGVAGYGIYVNETLVATTAEDGVTVSELTCATKYALAIDAYDAAGNRSERTALEAETASCESETDTQPPTTPAELGVTAASDTELELAWQQSSDDVGVAGYAVLVNGTLVAKTPTTGYLLTRLTCATVYTLAVEAYDAAGNRSEQATIDASTTDCSTGEDSEPPTVPSELLVESASEMAVELAWQPATDNVAVAGYGVYQNGAPVGTTQETRFTLSGLTCGRSYSFSADAYDAAGHRSEQTTVVASTAPCPDTQPPAAPAGLRATDRTRTSISLAWNPGSDAPLVGYGIYRNGLRIATTAGTTYAFGALACDTTYTLGVDAYDAAGNRSPQTTILVATLACADPPPPPPGNDDQPAHFCTSHECIPNFGSDPTIVSVRSGAWSDETTWSQGRLPSERDVVAITDETVVTVDRLDAEARTVAINDSGELRFGRNTDTRLSVGTLLVQPGGRLEIGTAGAPIPPDTRAEVVFASRPLDLQRDPEQFGVGLVAVDGEVSVHGAEKDPTWVRLAEEARGHNRTLALSEAVSGWKPGDELILPDTRQGDFGPGLDVPGESERSRVAAVSQDGRSVTLTEPLAHDHLGARDRQGALRLLPHVANATRNVSFRSEDPAGTRAQTLFTGRTRVAIRYAEFRDLGRTTNDELHSTTFNADGTVAELGTNQKGRYSAHLHHLTEPAVFAGNALVDNTKWPLSVHNTHYSRIARNVIAFGSGAGSVTEDGSESFNTFEGNFVTAIVGFRGREKFRTGREGDGFWFAGPNNDVANNVAAAVAKSGYNVYGGENSSQPTFIVPAFPGADPDQDGLRLNTAETPLRRFSGNEAYSTRSALETWYLGYENYYNPVASVGESLVQDFRAWHTHRSVLDGNQQNHLTFDGLLALGDADRLGQYDFPVGLAFGQSKQVVVRNSEIQQVKIGIFAPGAGDRFDPTLSPDDVVPTVIEHSRLDNVIDIFVDTFSIDAFAALPPRKTRIRNVRFGAGLAIVMGYGDGRFQNVVHLDQVFVEAFDGIHGDDFRVYRYQQAPDFVVPQTGSNDEQGPGSPQGAPEAGRTNAEAIAEWGIAIGGEIAPCLETRERIGGYVC